MTYTLDCLKVVSYNCRGWKSGSNYVQSLLQSCDICLIQEHWLLCENLDSLIISDDFLSVGVSGMDSSILLTGRPFGGCSILTLRAALHELYFDLDLVTSACFARHPANCSTGLPKVFSKDLQVCQCIRTHMKLSRSPCELHKLWPTLVHHVYT